MVPMGLLANVTCSSHICGGFYAFQEVEVSKYFVCREIDHLFILYVISRPALLTDGLTHRLCHRPTDLPTFLLTA
jgi:hypothetical protein